jgi:hypothetical protein
MLIEMASSSPLQPATAIIVAATRRASFFTLVTPKGIAES